MIVPKLAPFFQCNNCGKIHCRYLVGLISVCTCGRILVKGALK